MVIKNLLIVAPQFPPCNLTAGHRTRLLVRHLLEFDYNPIILTSKPELYEESCDPELLKMVCHSIQIIRVGGIPVKPIRLVGDIGARTLFSMLVESKKIIQKYNVDLVHIPIPPNYTALLGPLLKAFCGVPYILDYIDPWVYPIPDQDFQSVKALVSHSINRILEPFVASYMDGVAGVAESYLEGLFLRHPQLRQIPRAGVPYGSETIDHDVALQTRPDSEILTKYHLTDCVTLVYAGAFLPRSVMVAKVLFEAVKHSRSSLPQNFRLVFVGTGLGHGSSIGMLTTLAKDHGVADLVVEIPQRQPFGAILRLLHHASGVLVLGSTEKHYTASKTFQALESESPILALLHQESHAAELLKGMPGISLATFGEDFHKGVVKPNFEGELFNWLKMVGNKFKRSLDLIPEFSARSMARKMANLYDRVLGLKN